MTEREKRDIQRLMENEAAEWAMRECIKGYRKSFMPFAMQLKGYHEAMINVGFSREEAMELTIEQIYAVSPNGKA